jgi:predicted DNA-binding protein with PD1-like motif
MGVQSRQEGPLVVAKLDDGEDLFAGLERLCRMHRIESGFVLWAIGMLRDCELGYFDGTAYVRRVHEEPRELVALHGSLTTKDEVKAHLHCALADRDNRVIGGHLFRAKVAVLNELVLRRLDHVRLSRRLDEGTGLRQLVVD